MENPIIAWFSGGVTSAVACKLAIELFGKENIRCVFIDTQNEHEDTFRFLKDCEKWYELPIESITGLGSEGLLGGRYNTIEDIWDKYKSLNVAHGAVCSSTLKRRVREIWQKNNKSSGHIFGFDIDEPKRAKSMALNNSKLNPIFPLLLYGLSKTDCIRIIEEAGIQIPVMYKEGYRNNNCFKSMCVQGGMGYWQKVRREYPEKYDKMADREHKYSKAKRKPVTMLRSKSKAYTGPVFLKHNPDFPECWDLSMFKPMPVKPLKECNGFCGINDLEPRNPTEDEINYID